MFTITKQTARVACRTLLAAALAAGALVASAATGTEGGETQTFGFGTPITEADVAGFFSSAPDGSGLPGGSGTAIQGKAVYAAQCVACHGAELQGGIGDRLIGGRGTLAEVDGKAAPIKTVESYWPYATTLFDYIKRAMPFTAPGSLSNDDVYAVTAYILNQGHIVAEDEVMSAQTLPKVAMPNRNGFRVSDR